MPQKQKLSPEQKVKLVQRCLAGELGVREAGQFARVDVETVRGWITRYEAEGAEAFFRKKRIAHIALT